MPHNEQLTETVWRRRQFLEHMQHGAITKEELVEELGCSKQNMYKRTGELKELGLVKQEQDKYSLTLYGELALQRFQELKEAREYEGLLTTESIEGVLPPHVIEGAEFMLSDSAIPDEPFAYIDKQLHGSDVVEGFSCALFSPNRVSSYYEAVVDKNTRLDAIANRQVVDYILLEHMDTAVTAFESGNITVHVTHQDIPFSVMIFDRNKIIVFANESTAEAKEIASIKGIIINDSTDAVDWALKQFEEYKENSERITLNDITRKEPGV